MGRPSLQDVHGIVKNSKMVLLIIIETQLQWIRNGTELEIYVHTKSHSNTPIVSYSATYNTHAHADYRVFFIGSG